MTQAVKETPKKIKGQISGRYYAFLVKRAERERCRVSAVIRDIVSWAVKTDIRLGETGVFYNDIAAKGHHVSCHFLAEGVLLEKWKNLKKLNGITNDSQMIRFAVISAYKLEQTKRLEAQQTQQTLNF